LKSRKLIVYAYVLMFLLVLSLSVLINNGESLVFATSLTNISVENYTDSDNLLKADGSLSNKNIKTFSNEVKGATSNTSFPELAQVVPKQYLESTTTNATYQYNGKEYGFYMVKEGDYFDLLLIDFVYEFDSGEHLNDYVIRIKPILQQSFLRTADSSGNYNWLKYGGNRYKYYVANPRFLTVLQNENALNYGDSGYSKSADDGLIIYQSRFNFGKVCYKTETDLAVELAEFSVKKYIDFTLDTTQIGSIICDVIDVVEFANDLYNEGQETTVQANNENNIFTEKSKSNQLNNTNLPSYSRVASVEPEQEIILSDAGESYAEFITLLNETNYRSRLNQYCEFDIARRLTNYESMEYVAGNWVDSNSQSLMFKKERVLFNNAEPQTVLEETDFLGKNVPLYLLPNGNQTFSFSPQYSGTYKFTIPSSTTISVDGANSITKSGNIYSVSLNAGGLYQIVVSNNSNGVINQTIRCDLPTIIQAISIAGNNNIIVQCTALENGYKKVMINNSNCAVKILNSQFEVVEESNTNYCYFNFTKNQKYFFVITNKTSSSLFVAVQISEPTTTTVDEVIKITADKEVLSFENSYNTNVQYKLTISWNSGSKTASVLDENGDNIAIVTISGNTKTYSFSLSAGEKCFIKYSHTDSSITSQITVDEQYLRWKIDGEVCDSNVRLQKGKDYQIELVSIIDGVEIPQSVSYQTVANNTYFELSNAGILSIKEGIDRGYDIVIAHSSYPSFWLVVNVKYVTVTFDNQGGTGGTDSVVVDYGYPIPRVAEPTREGYDFVGYFEAPNKQGTMYYDASMVNRPVYFENDTTLYAGWWANRYFIYFDLAGGGFGDSSAYVDYDEPFPTIYPPMRIGYKFLYFEAANGEKYYVNGVENRPFKFAENIYLTAHWELSYLEINLVNKVGNQWTIAITNNSSSDLVAEYNSKMCTLNGAKNWFGLFDIETIEIEKGETVEVIISENLFATSITISYESNDDIRLVTYANNLNNNNKSMSVYYNKIE